MTMKYKEMTWGQMEAVVNKLGGMEGVHRFLSGELTIKEEESQLQIFKVLVDYNQTLKQMIEAGKYDWVNNDITAKHFPVKGEGEKEIGIRLFHFDRTISSDGAIYEMKKAGYRPALIEELLALGASHKKLQKQFPIVALGSVWRGPDGDRPVPCLGWSGDGRGLGLDWLGGGWRGDWRFAAVRNAS